MIPESQKAFFDKYLPGGELDTRKERSYENEIPFVTLTYAQSLDGMIALGQGHRTQLSGSESKAMTHYLRNNHDAILIGATTAVVDDPGLNSRYHALDATGQPQAPNHPIPVVIDPKRRWNYEESKIAQLAREGNGKEPLIVRHRRRDHEHPAFEGEDNVLTSWEASATPPTKKIDWAAILNQLGRRGIKSVMVEGGAGVINDLLARPWLVDSTIITIAPIWLGSDGIHASPPPKTLEDGTRTHAVDLIEQKWRTFGKDTVMCGKLKR